MLYISLPVHENELVVIDQCKNFLKYADCKIIIHVSRNSNFCASKLNDLLIEKNLSGRVLLNPYSVRTCWGDIIRAHIQNIKYLVAQGVELSSKVAFHASNDLLIRFGLDSYVYYRDFLFHTRKYETPGLWWPSKIAFQDTHLLNLLKHNRRDYLVASQIEGSVYTLEFLKDVLKIIDDYRLLDSDLFYPREEILFSTIAEIFGIVPCGHPYVFSEVQRYDARLWKFWKKSEDIFPWWLSRVFNELLGKVFSIYGVGALTVADIISIRKNRLPKVIVYDHNSWVPYVNQTGIYGVKRVPRDINNDLRRYINALD